MSARSPEPRTTREVCRLSSPEELEALAGDLSLMAGPGLAVLIMGDLGAGKTTFARAFIRALAPGTPDLEVPSPTFTLLQTYGETRVAVAHADFYRLSAASEAAELGLDELVASHVLLVEWPERGMVPDLPDFLLVTLTGSGAAREIVLEGHGAWATLLRRHRAIVSFLERSGWGDARRTFFEGDASFRRYERLEAGERRAILMDMPARPDGPPVKDGLPYSAVAHLAEDIRRVAAVNGELLRRGYSAPAIEAIDLDQGLAIIEDLGPLVYGTMMAEGRDMDEAQRAAVALLADMAAQEWPQEVPVGQGETLRIQPYDEAAQLIEADLLPQWFWPYRHGVAVPEALREEFAGLWREVLPISRSVRPVWTLRDYHSPNLIWMPERSGLRRVGLIDTQDCVLGHPAYDLASLLQDARVDIEAATERRLLAHYVALRQQAAGFDRAAFEQAYAVLGAQRATKILGIFARLSKRDGKHGYLRHLPRVSGYLERDLAHPALARLRAWFDRHLPAAARVAPP
jgi:tRNA threonylcarbamoyl adenosine modification protein YjeE